MKHKILTFFLTVILIFTFSSVFFASANFNSEKDVVDKLHSYAYYMVSLDDETELFSKNEDKKVSPAAFNKILACVVALEEWSDLDTKVKITEKSLNAFGSVTYMRNVSLKVGETYTRRQMLDSVIVYSANDALSVIVENIAQTKEAYLQKMQALIKNIGCSDTKVIDILGFDAEGQYTTAKDVSKIIRYALKYPAFSEAFGQKTLTLPKTALNNERTYQSGNKMMNSAIADYYHSSVNGGKYTSTEKAGECIAVTTSKDGYSYLAVVMKGKLKNLDSDDSLENTCMNDAKTMISWVYNNIFFKVVASPNQVVSCMEIQAAKGTDTVKLVPEKEISVLAPSKVSSYSVLIEPIEKTVPKKIKAPVKKGEVICQAQVLYANKNLATINLVASEDISLSLTGLIISSISVILMSKVFIAAEIIAIILLSAFLIVKLYDSSKKKSNGLKIVSNNTKKKK